MVNGIHGRAATGLADTTWAVSEAVARAGTKGELRSEEVLNRFGGRAAVMHDLRVPIPGFKANIDHVVVSGNRVLIIDSKLWKPGFYWTFGGHNRRGWEKVPHTAKDQDWIRRAVVRHLSGTGAEVLIPHLAVWPSRGGAALRTGLLKVSGARVIPGRRLASVTSSFIRRTPADDVIVGRLATLLTTPDRAPGRRPAA